MARSRSPGTSYAISKFWRNKRGATAIEYALMVALISLVVIAAVSALYTAIVNNFNIIVNYL